MKRLKVLVAIMLVLTIFFVPSVSLAYYDFCQFAEGGEHDFTYSSTKTNRHPHSGYRECECGERVYYDSSYYDECEKCRLELCNNGIHYYLVEVYYTSDYSGYGECYCGRTKQFLHTHLDRINEVYPGIIERKGSLYAIQHPHFEYDENEDLYYEEEYPPIYLMGCEACDLLSEYYREVEEYEINTIVYGNYNYDSYNDYYEQDNEYEEYYYDYDDYRDYNDYDYYEYEDEYSDEYTYDEDDDFYEWLDIMQEILGSD